VPDLQPLL